MASELRGNGLIRMYLCRGGLPARFLPAWAVTCGALASGRLVFTPESSVRLLLAMLLVDVGWGAVWEALATADWATPLRRWQNWRLGDPSLSLPYTRPGSPGDRITRWLAQLGTWGRDVLLPAVGRALEVMLAGLLLSIVLAAALGPELMSLTLGTLALMQLASLLGRRRGQIGSGWDGVIRLGLPWLAGHLLFAPLTFFSLAAALAFSLAAAGMSHIGQVGGRVLGLAGQLGAALLLVFIHRPLAVPFLVLFLIPQWLLLQVGGQKPVRRAWIWFAAGMLLVAWAL